jgi:hypothetical protein
MPEQPEGAGAETGNGALRCAYARYQTAAVNARAGRDGTAQELRLARVALTEVLVATGWSPPPEVTALVAADRAALQLTR